MTPLRYSAAMAGGLRPPPWVFGNQPKPNPETSQRTAKTEAETEAETGQELEAILMSVFKNQWLTGR